MFYEYFHGDYGAGLSASHQTGWTGIVATLINLFCRVDPHDLLARGVANGVIMGQAKELHEYLATLSKSL